MTTIESPGPNGLIFRDGDTVVVRVLGAPYLLEQEGVACENPDAPEGERIYRKVFRNKNVFLPGELQDALDYMGTGENVLRLAMTGYSSIKPADLDAWGIKPGAYEAACAEILGRAVKEIQAKMPLVEIQILDGASDMGVDRAVISVAEELEVMHLGFSCPNFMMYVKDDTAPVYVASTQAEYADAFVRSLDILYSVGGRKQALEHDMLAAIKYNKRLVLLNILKALSTKGGPPSRDPQGNVLDATSAFEETIHMYSPGRYSADPFADLLMHAIERTTAITRGVVSPDAAFGGWR